MLLELHIRNFAIIDSLDLSFEAGFIVFTGETGAGKSIILDAVDALMGARTDSTLVRTGAERAIIEGTFRLDTHTRAPVHAILTREDLLDDPDYLTLGREIRANGRSVARLNGRTVSAALLREVGAHLVDLHGQSEHLSLLRPTQHIRLLDRYAETEPLLSAYRETYHRLQQVRKEQRALQQASQDAARRVDLLTYQVNEIESAALKPDEEERLRAERNRLANAESLASLAQRALQALDEGTPTAPAATDLVGEAAEALEHLAELDSEQGALSQQVNAALETLSESARLLRRYLEEIEFDPDKLDETEERLDLIHNLKRKYGATIAEVLAYGEKARQELENITSSEERLAQLQAEETRLLQTLARRAQALSQARHKAAESLAKAIQAQLDDLRMEGARFQVDFATRPDPQGLPFPNGERLAFDRDGHEQVTFLIAPNPGEGFKPLVKIASGGETARLMLALKHVLAQADPVPTLIFDEIDQGIGGRIGAVVGQKMRQLAASHQVLCITHLPQLAAFGTRHFHVQKHLRAERTTTSVTSLEGENRIQELAQMLGDATETGLAAARRMLDSARQPAL
ncbi:MAG: DNA repair protein RecN [Anaerolineae bacterium]|nr:MAG: DNA repair protein RecN [Anaerolineae bacterium]